MDILENQEITNNYIQMYEEKVKENQDKRFLGELEPNIKDYKKIPKHSLWINIVENIKNLNKGDINYQIDYFALSHIQQEEKSNHYTIECQYDYRILTEDVLEKKSKLEIQGMSEKD